MDWLARLILLSGTALAATLGLALAALLVRTALEKSSSDLPAQEDFRRAGSRARPLTTLRGYDTPELWREDARVRAKRLDKKYFH